MTSYNIFGVPKEFDFLPKSMTIKQMSCFSLFVTMAKDCGISVFGHSSELLIYFVRINEQSDLDMKDFENNIILQNKDINKYLGTKCVYIMGLTPDLHLFEGALPLSLMEEPF